MVYVSLLHCIILYIIILLQKENLSGNILFFLWRGEVLCIRASNFRNDSTCLLHLVLGIIM